MAQVVQRPVKIPVDRDPATGREPAGNFQWPVLWLINITDKYKKFPDTSGGAEKGVGLRFWQPGPANNGTRKYR